MEESIAYLREQFQLPQQDIRTYSPLALAYIGDGIYELYIRTIVVGRGNRQASKLHHAASRLVKAPTQALMAEALEAEFTPKEEAVSRRGRHAKSYSTAKNATTGQYRKATGFEAEMGYLNLTGQYIRMIDLIKMGLEAVDEGK